VSSYCVRATNSKFASLKRYVLHTSCKYSTNSNAVSNMRQDITYDKLLLD